MSTDESFISADEISANSRENLRAQDSFDKEALPEKIGKNLRQIYDDVLAEPVPDDFLSLLTKADKNAP